MLEKTKKIQTLLVRLVLVGGMAVLCWTVYRFFFDGKKGGNYVLDKTPLRVEQIRKIAELNTLQFKDEVVVDTVEYYAVWRDGLEGCFQKVTDYNQIKNSVTNIKRRLTLIVKGELLYGIDLKKHEIRIKEEEKKLIVGLPQPELLSVVVTPQKTQIFIENGTWNDYERRLMQRKAQAKMIHSGEKLSLAEKAKEPLESVIRKLIQTDKTVVIEYYQQ